MSRITALDILIEVLEFRQPRYLLILALGLPLSYSGTGSMLLLFFLPLASLPRRAGLPVLLILVFAFGLFATGLIDSSVFLSRVGEFDDTRASGFQRFVSPFWLANEHFGTGSRRVLLLGSSPGITADFVGAHKWYAGQEDTWIKLLYEYGLIGSFVFICFLLSCFRRVICSKLLVGAIAFYYVSLGGLLLNTSFLIMTIVLCTLHAPDPWRGRIGETSRYRRSLLVRSVAG